MDLLLQFLNQPVSGSDVHVIADAHKWHARLMVLGWGVMIPTGVVVARYFKVLRRQDWPRQLDNRRWWHLHLTLQIAGTLLSFAAVLLAFRASGAAGSGLLPAAGVTVHQTLGWAIVTLGIAQVLGGALRGSKGERGPIPSGDHFLMTGRRCAFEYLHKASGYLALGLAALNILVGLAISDALVWMWLVILGYWGALGVACVVLQRQGRCVDTYQAIYGPDARLPGNARAPIGWGVRRYDVGQWPPARLGGSVGRVPPPATLAPGGAADAFLAGGGAVG